MKEDTEAVVKKRYHLWNDNVQKIEEAYKKVLLNIQTDIKSELITDLIADAIQNPIYWTQKPKRKPLFIIHLSSRFM